MQRATADWHDGDVLDLHQVLGTLTLDIVGHTLLGVDLSARSSDIRGALESALREFGRAPAAGSLIPRRTDPSALPSDAFVAVHAALDAVIDERRRNPSDDRGDVISALLAAQEAGLTDEEIHDNAMTLVMAGHETTANALSWTLHLLGQHPGVARALHEELRPLAGRAPRWDELPNLIYTRAVLTEAMRLYPPAWVMGRTLTTPVTLGAWTVPAQTIVAASPLLLHHDPRWFPAPETFDPARWLDIRKESVPRNAYLPFGTGPRSCIGEQFAWAEATTVLATIAGTWSAQTLAEHQVVPQYAVTLRPGNGLPMRLNLWGGPARPVE